jgi:hypothetical protein
MIHLKSGEDIKENTVATLKETSVVDLNIIFYHRSTTSRSV